MKRPSPDQISPGRVAEPFAAILGHFAAAARGGGEAVEARPRRAEAPEPSEEVPAAEGVS